MPNLIKKDSIKEHTQKALEEFYNHIELLTLNIKKELGLSSTRTNKIYHSKAHEQINMFYELLKNNWEQDNYERKKLLNHYSRDIKKRGRNKHAFIAATSSGIAGVAALTSGTIARAMNAKEPNAAMLQSQENPIIMNNTDVQQTYKNTIIANSDVQRAEENTIVANGELQQAQENKDSATGIFIHALNDHMNKHKAADTALLQQIQENKNKTAAHLHQAKENKSTAESDLQEAQANKNKAAVTEMEAQTHYLTARQTQEDTRMELEKALDRKDKDAEKTLREVYDVQHENTKNAIKKLASARDTTAAATEELRKAQLKNDAAHQVLQDAQIAADNAQKEAQSITDKLNSGEHAEFEDPTLGDAATKYQTADSILQQAQEKANDANYILKEAQEKADTADQMLAEALEIATPEGNHLPKAQSALGNDNDILGDIANTTVAAGTIATVTSSAVLIGTTASIVKEHIRTHIKKHETEQINKYLKEEDQPIAELLISLLTLYSVEKLSSKKELNESNINRIAKKKYTLLIENLIKLEKNKKKELPHLIADELLRDYSFDKVYLLKEKESSLKHWLGALEQTLKKGKHLDLNIFLKKISTLREKTSLKGLDGQTSLPISSLRTSKNGFNFFSSQKNRTNDLRDYAALQHNNANYI